MTTTARAGDTRRRSRFHTGTLRTGLVVALALTAGPAPGVGPRLSAQQPLASPSSALPQQPAAAPTSPPPQQAEPAPQTPPAQPTPADVPQGQVPQLTFEVAVELVSVDVVVVDPTGRPVRGLTKDDFELEVDGAPRVISSSLFVEQSSKSGPPVSEQFSTNEGAAGGRLLMVVVDQGNIRRAASTAFIRAAEHLLDDLGPGDRVALAIIPGGMVMDFTPHIASLRAALMKVLGAAPGHETSRTYYSIGASEALAYDAGQVQVLDEVAQRECIGLPRPTENEPNPGENCRRELAVELQTIAQSVRAQTTNSLTALRRLLVELAKVSGPKTLVLLTEGLYLDRTPSQVAWVSETSAAARASLYAVVLDDTFADMDTSSRKIGPTTSADRRVRQEGVDTLVRMARGNAQYVSSGARGAFERLSRELTGYYLLGFEPEPSERDGKPHGIRVKVKRPGVELRARRTFTVDAPPTTARSSKEVLAETLRDPLLATEVRLRVATYSFPDPDPTSGKVRLLMSTGLGLPSDDAPVVGVAYRLMDSAGKLVTAAVEPAGKRTGRDHRWNGIVVVAPGTYMLKVAAVDSDGRRGSVEHRLEASLTSAGALKLGDLMLSEEGAAAAAGLLPEIEPRVTTARVDGYIEVGSADANTLGNTSATLEIAADANGPALVSAPLNLVVARSAGRRVGQAEVPLVNLPPGDYVARAVVGVGGRPVARVLREFRFAPSAEVRARSTGGATSLTLLRLSFDPKSVLAGDLLTRMLQPVARNNLSDAVANAVAQAGRGELTTIPDALPSGGNDPAAALLRGIGFYARGDLEPAAAELRRALLSDSGLSAAVFYLGACYAAGGRDREAVGAWQTTLAAETLDPAVFSLTTEAYLRLKEWPAAIDVAKEAAAEWPDDAGIQRQLIRAQALGGQQREALQAVDGFLARQPADHEVALLGMKLIYDGAADGRSVAAPREDLVRFDRYLAAYRNARGPEAALAERWRATVAGRAEN